MPPHNVHTWGKYESMINVSMVNCYVPLYHNKHMFFIHTMIQFITLIPGKTSFNLFKNVKETFDSPFNVNE